MDLNIVNLGVGLRRLRTRFYMFINWWYSELGRMLPDKLRSYFSNSDESIIVELGPHHKGIVWAKGAMGQIRKIGDVSLDEDDRAYRDDFNLRIGGLKRVSNGTLRYHSSDVLEFEACLPVATLENLDVVLRTEIDRLTPFDFDSVYYGYKIIEQNDHKNILRIKIRLQTRKNINACVDRLKDYGIPVSAVEVVQKQNDEAPQVVGIPININPNNRRKRDRISISLFRWKTTPVLIALAAAAIYLPLYNYDLTISDLAEQESQLKSRAQKASTIKREISSSIDAGNLFVSKRMKKPINAFIIKELTRIIPDDTWLSQLEINGQQIRLQGESKNASKLIQVIEESSLFRETSFSAPITVNPKTGKDRFMIVTKLVDSQGVVS
ncbi:MAG: hypothetical protein GC138_08380 [Gammaproteobacteria bacterium]|nr:hypothetical protein [Gammaproteobacteria bacterium]